MITVCEHNRLYERFSWQINLNHYLATLPRKPGAVGGSVALRQAPAWMQDMYLKYFVHDSRSFIDLLQYCQLNDIDSQQMNTCVNKLAVRFPGAVSAVHVMAMLGNQCHQDAIATPQTDPIAQQSVEKIFLVGCSSAEPASASSR